MKNFKTVLFLLLCFLAFACNPTFKVAEKPGSANPAPKAKKQLTEEESINLKFLFVNANKEKILGNPDKAAEFFAQCIRIDGSNHASMFELAQIYREQKKINDALFFARSAHEIDKSNVWYSLFLGELLMIAKKSAEAEQIFSDLFKKYSYNVDYAFKYASALLYNGKFTEAIKIYDRIEEEIGVNQELIMEKERLWVRLGKIDKAAQEIEKLVADNPKEIKSYSLLVELYQVNNMPEKALETIARMQAIDSTSPYVYLALAEYYRSQKQKDKSFEQLKLAFGSQELEQDLKIKIISSYLPIIDGNPEMLEQGLSLSSIMAESHPNDGVSQAIYGDFLAMKKDFSKAAEQYMKSLAIDNKNFTVWQQLMICHNELSDFKAMLKTSNDALELFPDQSVLYLFNGIALSRENKNDEAVKKLLAGSKIVVDNNEQLRQFYTNLADNYNTLKKFEDSDKFFDKALQLEPNDPLVLNNYSYYLSVRNEKLEKAEAMSKQSNDLRPDQPSYQDTYGWILYMMGKYEDSKLWLQKAIDNGGADNGTILEHMGDVLFKLGSTDKAVEFWKRAKDKGDVSEFIDKKINDKKLYE